jgi:hypothetical protein
MARDIASHFPFKVLQRMAVGSQGISHVDYCGHILMDINTKSIVPPFVRIVLLWIF